MTGVNFGWHAACFHRAHVVGAPLAQLESYCLQGFQSAIKACPDQEAQQRNDQKRGGKEPLDELCDQMFPQSQTVADQHANTFCHILDGVDAPGFAVDQPFGKSRANIT